MSAPLDGDRLVQAKSTNDPGPDRLHSQGVNLISGRCTDRSAAHHNGPKAQTPQDLVGDDVAFDTRSIYGATNPGQVEWYATDGLNNLVLRSYANGRAADHAITEGKLCPDDLTPKGKLDLLRYHTLHDALSYKAHQFAAVAKDKTLEARLMQEWELGFLRKPTETRHHHFF
jgi:hypothetical protein